MNITPGSRFAWRDITFRTKLVMVFALQLLLIAVIGVTAFFSLRASARQREVLRTAQELRELALNLELEFVEERSVGSVFECGCREPLFAMEDCHLRFQRDGQAAGDL